jgi:hypothetical protein
MLDLDSRSVLVMIDHILVPSIRSCASCFRGVSYVVPFPLSKWVSTRAVRSRVDPITNPNPYQEFEKDKCKLKIPECEQQKPSPWVSGNAESGVTLRCSCSSEDAALAILQ